MSDFFARLELQRRHENQEIVMGGLISFLAAVAIVKYTSDPSSLLEYVPTIFGAIPGAAVVAGIVERRESQT